MRWALVTGASRGIGAATARALAAAGHPVLVNFREREDAAAEVERAIEAHGGRARRLRFDVCDRQAVWDALAPYAGDEEGDDGISIVVNNAGIVADAPFPAMEFDAWERVTRTTLDGFYNVTRPLVMPMVRRRWGRIINVSSVSGVMGNRGQVNYAAAKAGLIGATKSLALELAKRNVTVNAVAPGPIDTDMLAGRAREIVERIPMRRLGQADEVAQVIAFLASDAASYLTGQVITVGGGLG
jgi:3-oxoacyl-[acyl-carrier protein] reductase